MPRFATLRTLPLLLLLLALVFGALPPAQASPAPADATTASVRLIHFNDFHAAYLPTRKTDEEGLPRVGGAAALAGHIRDLRAGRGDALVAFAGDMVQASPLEKATTGESLLAIMNRIAPEVATIGNHEFDYGKARMRQLLAMAKFPLTCANLIDKADGKLFVEESVIVRTTSGVRLMFIGLYPLSGKSYVEKDHDVEVLEAAGTVDRIAKARDGETDLTVVLSHLGFDDDVKLAETLGRTSEVDLIIGGHSHTQIEAIDPAHPIPIVQAFANGLFLGVADIVADLPGKRIAAVDYRLLPTYTDKTIPDAAVEAIVAAEVAKMPELFEPIAKLEAPLGQESRHGETALGNFTVDAFAEIFAADLAFMNSKSIRNSLPGPEVCRNEVNEAFPFEGGLYRIRMTGAQVVRMLEYYANEKKDRVVYAPHSLFYKFRLNKKGQMNIASIEFSGKPLEEAKKYTVIVDDRSAKEFERFYEAEIVEQVAGNIAATLIDHLLKKKTVPAPKMGRSERVDAPPAE